MQPVAQSIVPCKPRNPCIKGVVRAMSISADENRKKTTIKDVARLARVAPSTVSRVVAGSPRISPETHSRVRQAMEELNYHPNAIATSLARRRTGTIGLTISRPAEQAFANPFFAEVIRGIGSVLHDEGYTLLLSFTQTPEEERQACLRLLRENRVDGVILTSARVRDRLIDELQEEGYPFVLIGRVLGKRPVSWVNNDNVAVGFMATEHLIARGHRRIALINGSRDQVVSVDRRQGYVEAMRHAGIATRPEYEVDGGFSLQGGRGAMERLLALAEPPTAVFAIDDLMALGALIALRERGMATGTVAVVGVNDDPLSAYLAPPLSTVRVPVFDLGATAARTLMDLMVRGAAGPRRVILPAELIVRQSSDWRLT